MGFPNPPRDIENELAKEGLVRMYESGRYLQTGDNCFEIARFLAARAGYDFPESRLALRDTIFEEKARRLWGNTPSNAESEASLLVRTPDNPSQAHVTFCDGEREYNFSVGDEEGFLVELRIPLSKSRRST